jgi:hypothetical protein
MGTIGGHTGILICIDHRRLCVLHERQIRHGQPGIFREPCDSSEFEFTVQVSRQEVDDIITVRAFLARMGF